jgi:hypothetical protein
MGERSDQITQDIVQARAELGSNLQDLERKVKDFADWRAKFRRSPFTMIGIAFGGGILLARALGRRRSRRNAYVNGKAGGDPQHLCGRSSA